jgi:chorismate mutase/prephenate dehydratase
MDLEKLREQIDKIDRELVRLFEERTNIVSKVADYKRKNGISVLDQKREDDLIEKNVSYLKDPSLSMDMERFFRALMEISRDYQSRKISIDSVPNSKDISFDKNSIIGYQGVEGSYSYEALKKYFGDTVQTRNLESFEKVFMALNSGEINYGVLPIDNSSTGEIKDTYDLIRGYGAYIIGEVELKVSHNLLGVKGAKISDIKKVYSHSQGFQQCDKFLKGHPDWQLIPYQNTAVSAKYVSESKSKSKAAIASMLAKELYDLELLADEINSSSNNFTRFIIIGKELVESVEFDKVSVVFSSIHKAGALYSIIKDFAENNINMLSIKSRPISEKPWEYFFYVDFEGNFKDENIKKALSNIKNKSNYFKILGNYKKW